MQRRSPASVRPHRLRGGQSLRRGPALDFERLELRAVMAGFDVGQIRGEVFYDGDGNGSRASDEPGLAGWTLYLDENDNRQFDANEPSTESDGAGNYLFTDVLAGSHRLRIVERPGWGRTVPYADYFSVDVRPDESVGSFQFGVQIEEASRYAEISGRVWHDLDQNGMRSASEPYLAGWQVYLDLNQNRVRDPDEPATSTNAGGVYSFDRLPPSAFVVRQVVPAGWRETFPVGGGHFVVLHEGESAEGYDFGDFLASPGKLSGYKWRDLDQDGVQDPQEPALANWEFFLDLDHDGQRDVGEPTTRTNTLGEFQFLGLGPGRYDVGEVLPTGWNQTSPGRSSGFSAARSYDVPAFPTMPGPDGDNAATIADFATADLDGDGDLDAVTTAGAAAIVLWNDGRGELISRLELPLPESTSTGSVAVADLDGDGRLDLVVGGKPSSASASVFGHLFVFLNGPSGLSASALACEVPVSPDFLAVGDFDADGDVDVASAARAGRTIALSFGAGAGGLSTVPNSLNVAPGVEIAALATGDFDRDGRSDVAVIGQNTLFAGPFPMAMFQAWTSRPNGLFASASPVPVTGVARDLLVANLRGDAAPEIVALVESTGPNGAMTTAQEFQFRSGVAALGPSWDVHRGGGLAQARSPALQIADFNRDGLADLVVLDELGRSLWIMSGRSDGTLDFPRAITLADEPFAVVAERFDGDAAPDLAVLSRYSSSVTVLLNDGFGGFPYVDLLNARAPLDQVDSVDVDRDGDLDLVGVSFESGRLVLALNQGGGRFSSPRVLALEPHLAVALFGDLDGDGWLDLVTIDNRTSEAGGPLFDLRVRSSFAAGGLATLPAAHLVQTLDGFATAASLADLNRDARLDLVVTFGASAQSAALDRRVFLGANTGSFAVPSGFVLRPELTGERLLFDVDQDGDLDRFSIQTATHSLALEWNLGGGRFDEPHEYFVGTSPRAMLAADLDGDRDLDVLVLDQASSVWSWLQNDGATGFSPSLSFDVGGSPSAVTSGDFDGDGLLDLALADDATNIVKLLRQTAPGSFAAAGQWSVGRQPAQIATGDWNGDGRLDLATLDVTDGTLSLLLQSASAFDFMPNAFPTGLAPERFETGYFDADGTIDFAVSGTQEGARRVFELLNDGAGGLLAPTPQTLDRNVRDSAIADVNGDLNPDLVVVDDFSRTLFVFPGTGSGDFLAPSSTPLDARPHFVRPADVDGDHDVDLSIGWLDLPSVGLLINDGQGHWSTGDDYRLGAPPPPFWTGDLDDDGRTDYVVPNPHGGFYDYGRGRGDGTFAPPTRYAGDLPGVVGAGDLDGDGNVDLFGSLLGDHFGIYWNQTRSDDEYRVTVLPGDHAGGLNFGNYLTPRPWQNPRSLLDVNDDTFVSPIDALLVIDRLNLVGGGPLPPPVAGDVLPPYLDTSGDDFVSAIDALLIINHLNRLAAAEGEGEGPEAIDASEASVGSGSARPAPQVAEIDSSRPAASPNSLAPVPVAATVAPPVPSFSRFTPFTAGARRPSPSRLLSADDRRQLARDLLFAKWTDRDLDHG